MKSVRRDLIALAACCVAMPAVAADWREALYNRQPAPGDLVLSAPCGGAMVFRAVDVPGDTVFDDQKMILGGREPDRAFMENPRATYLSGTFKAEGAWGYYLGKYEVGAAQYAAINGDCPDADDIEGALPKTEVTMAEAVMTAERYTDRLFAAAPDALPHENGAPDYLRLPTEAEWEYATRGGAAVGSADFDARLPPMPGPPERSIVFCTTDCEAELIGMRDPNPLGVHDMLGNARELVNLQAKLKILADYVARLDLSGSQDLNRHLLALGDVLDTAIATRSEQRGRAAREMQRVAVIAGLVPPRQQASEARCAELMELDADRYRARCAKVSGDASNDPDYYLDHLARVLEAFPEVVLDKQIAGLKAQFASRSHKALVPLPVVVSNIGDVRVRGADDRAEIARTLSYFKTNP
jgi:hypothetical protein